MKKVEKRIKNIFLRFAYNSANAYAARYIVNISRNIYIRVWKKSRNPTHRTQTIYQQVMISNSFRFIFKKSQKRLGIIINRLKNQKSSLRKYVPLLHSHKAVVVRGFIRSNIKVSKRDPVYKYRCYTSK